MSITCKFELSRTSNIYYSGEEIVGAITICSLKQRHIEAITLEFCGETTLQWWEFDKTKENIMHNDFSTQEVTNKTLYKHQQKHVCEQLELASSMNCLHLMAHVEYRFPFCFIIPERVPATLHCPYGQTKYGLRLQLQHAKKVDKEFHQRIVVKNKLDLSKEIKYKELPIKEENLKYLCQWPCTSGPLCFTLMLPYAGYVPGQHIKYFLELDNQSPHYDVLGVEACLKQHYVFLARKLAKRNFYTKSLAKSSIDERTLRLTKRLYEGNVRVPTDTPRSTLNLNYIVFIHYTLQVKLKTGAFHYDTDISAPVVIGTVPLRQFQDEQRRLEQNSTRECNICSGSISSGGNLVTTQPTLRLRRELESLLSSQDMQQRDLCASLEKSIDDEPPSYDSCLPPSFSFALTFGSFRDLPLGRGDVKSEENRRINIQLPQFPGYNTFNSHTQAPNQSQDSLLDDGENIYNSYASIYTDHTGRSLDTLDVLSCTNTDDQGEDVNEYLENTACKADRTTDLEQEVAGALRERSTRPIIHREPAVDENEEELDSNNSNCAGNQ